MKIVKTIPTVVASVISNQCHVTHNCQIICLEQAWVLYNTLYFSTCSVFATSNQYVIEPSAGVERQLTVNVVRGGGTFGFVTVEWTATLNGNAINNFWFRI